MATSSTPTRRRVALVTGGTSGIGAAAVSAFASAGYSVAFTGRRDALGLKLQSSVENTHFIQTDHRVAVECEACVRACVAKFDRIDVLFNNSGVVFLGRTEDTSEDDLIAQLSDNVLVAFRMTKLVLPGMLSAGSGVVINNSSDWGLVGARGAVAYCTSKAALCGMTRAVALDVASAGIRVLAIAPGDTFVDRWTGVGYGSGKGKQPVTDIAAAKVSNEIPLGRVARVEEIAAVVVFLASDGASFMTGCIVPIDGGNTAQ